MRKKNKTLITVFLVLIITVIIIPVGILLKNTYSVAGNSRYLTDQTGKLGQGVENIFLEAFLNISNTETHAEDNSFKNVINYVDENGNITNNVFMDTFLFMPSGVYYQKNANNERPNFVYTFKKAEITNYLNSEITDMHRIDNFITSEINSKYGTRPKLNVFMTITLPQDSNCKSSRANAKTCLTNFIQSSIDSFNNANFTNLKLVGFYWLEEIVKPNYFTENNIIDFNSVVHEKGYKSLWIPYIDYYSYQTNPGPYLSDTGFVLWGSYSKWQSYGFDFASLQTGHYFKGANDKQENGTQYDNEWMRLWSSHNPNSYVPPNRLTASHFAAEKFNMGIELELDWNATWYYYTSNSTDDLRRQRCKRYKEWLNQASYHSWDQTIKTYYIFKAFQYGERGYPYVTNYLDSYCSAPIRYIYDATYHYAKRTLNDYINVVNSSLNCDDLPIDTRDSFTKSVNKITFDANGGTGNETKYAQCSSASLYNNSGMGSTSTVPTPTYSGKTLTGWYTKASGGTKVLNADGSIAASVAGYTKNNVWHTYYDQTLYAHWETTHKVKIKYNANGGSLANTHGEAYDIANNVITKNNEVIFDTIDYGSKKDLYNYDNTGAINIIKPGYHIDSTAVWNTKADGTGKSFNQSSTYASTEFCDASSADCEITLYANWKPNQLKIKYNVNGGSLANEHGEAYSVSNGYITKNNEVFYSTYNYSTALGGSGLLNYNSKNYANIQKTGYHTETGKEWYKLSDGVKIYFGQDDTTINPNSICDITDESCEITLYINWIKDSITEYKVTYNYVTNGGISSTLSSYNTTAGINVNLAPTATKTGWTFVGWNTNKDATSGLSSYTMPNNDVTLYAIFRKEAVTLKANFNANGATLSSTASKSCTIAAVYNKNSQGTECTVYAPTITREGYTAIGYNTSANSTTNNIDQYNPNTRVLTLRVGTDAGTGRTWYAITTANRHKITFNASPGTINGVSSLYVEYNSNKTYQNTSTNTTISIPTASLDGYMFKGWVLNGGKTLLINPDKSLENASGYISDGKWIITSDIIVYPKWEKMSEVTYNCTNNGGTGANTSITYSEGAAVDLTKTCTKSGWTFVGWNTNKNATSKLNSYTMTDSDVTLYAIYRKEEIELSAYFNGNGATLTQFYNEIVPENIQFICVLSAVYNNDIQETTCKIVTPNITRIGHTIIGFNTDPNSKVNNSSYNTTGLLTLNVNDDSGNGRIWYAITRPNRYKVTFNAISGSVTGNSSLYVEYGSEELYQDNDSNTLADIPTASLDDYDFLGWYTSTGVKLINTDGSINTVNKYTSNSNWLITENKTLYAHYKSTGSETEPADTFEFINKTDYDIDEDVVYQLTPGMDKEDMFNKVNTNGILEVVDIDSHIVTDNARLRTGYKLRATFTTKILEYTISVKGDVLGTGELSTENAQEIAKHLIFKDMIHGDEYLLAADYNGDGEIRSNDIVKMLKDKKIQENP